MQAIPGGIKALVNGMPDENTDQNTTQPPYRLSTCFSVMSSLTPKPGIHDTTTEKKFSPEGDGRSGRGPLPPKHFTFW